MKTDLLPPLAFVDIETTGNVSTSGRIIEIGIIRVEQGQIVRTMDTLLNPNMYLQPFISEMTGIQPEDLQSAPSFREKMEDIYEILEGTIFVAHNARFDYGFVRNEFKRHNYTFTAKVLDTVKLSRMLFPEHQHHGLDKIIERFGIICEARHRAYGDAKVLYDFIEKLQIDYPEKPLHTTIHHLIKEPSLPKYLSHEDISDLDEVPGVYIFYDESDHPLYIGKSKSLKNRILSHFSGDHTSTTEMIISQQVRRIETIKTAGELGALILESQLIKEKKPMYNRRLRMVEEWIAVKEKKTKEGYLSVELVSQQHIPVQDLPKLLFIAKSKSSAKSQLEKICKESGLCKKLMGLEKTSGSCFNYKIGKCTGACVGKVKPEKYNAQHHLTFKKLRVPEWPYSGPILLTESSRKRGITEVFLFDNWCFLTKVNSEDIYEVIESSYEYEFDYDTYKILKLYLRKHLGKVKQLKDLMS